MVAKLKEERESYERERGGETEREREEGRGTGGREGSQQRGPKRWVSFFGKLLGGQGVWHEGERGRWGLFACIHIYACVCLYVYISV